MNNVVTSDRFFVWSETPLVQERNGSGGVVRRLFDEGMVDGSVELFFVRAQYDYDAWGAADEDWWGFGRGFRFHGPLLPCAKLLLPDALPRL